MSACTRSGTAYQIPLDFQPCAAYIHNMKKASAGPRMLEIAAYVARFPGCTLMDAAYSLIYHGRSSNMFGYAAAWRAIRAGLVVAEERADKRRHYRLWPAGEVK